MSDRVLEISAAEFECGAKRLVAKLFEANRISPNPSREIPVISWMRGFDYDPHGSRQDHARLEELVVKAVLARKWFEGEAPRWMQPLPLSEDERVALNGGADRRLAVVANYGMTLQSLGWNIERAPSFMDYYAASMAG